MGLNEPKDQDFRNKKVRGCNDCCIGHCAVAVEDRKLAWAIRAPPWRPAWLESDGSEGGFTGCVCVSNQRQALIPAVNMRHCN